MKQNLRWNKEEIKNLLIEVEDQQFKKSKVEYNPNTLDKNGDTALGITCKKFPEFLSYLLKHSRLDVNAKDKNGTTALMLACANNTKIVPDLLNHPEIDVNAQNDKGWSALMLASRYSLELVTDLI